MVCLHNAAVDAKKKHSLTTSLPRRHNNPRGVSCRELPPCFAPVSGMAVSGDGRFERVFAAKKLHLRKSPFGFHFA